MAVASLSKDIQTVQLLYHLSQYDAMGKSGVVGLAIAAFQLQQTRPDLCSCEIGDKHLHLQLHDVATCLRLMSENTFGIDKKGLVSFFPIPNDNTVKNNKLKVHNHECYINTYAQHKSSKTTRTHIDDKGKKKSQTAQLVVETEEGSNNFVILPYTPVSSYKHQEFYKELSPDNSNHYLSSAIIPGGNVLCPINKDTSLREDFQNSLAYLFSPRGSLFVKIRGAGNAKYGVVHLHYTSIKKAVEVLSNSDFYERLQPERLLVTSSTEAGLTFLLDRECNSISSHLGVQKSTVVSFGSVPWNGQQKVVVDEREITPRTSNNHHDIALCYQYLPNKYIELNDKKKGKDKDHQDLLIKQYCLQEKGTTDPPKDSKVSFLAVNTIREYFISNIFNGLLFCHDLDQYPEIMKQMQYEVETMTDITSEFSDDWGTKAFCDAIHQSIKRFRMGHYLDAKDRGNVVNFDKIRISIISELKRCQTRAHFIEFLTQRTSVFFNVENPAFDLMWSRIYSDKTSWKKYKALVVFEINKPNSCYYDKKDDDDTKKPASQPVVVQESLQVPLFPSFTDADSDDN